MATTEAAGKAMKLLTENWPKAVSPLSAEIFFQVFEDVDDLDLALATNRMLRSDREFAPTPGQVLAAAKEILNERLHNTRLDRERQARDKPSPVLQITHGGNSRLHEIKFAGNWNDYAAACEAQAAIEWTECASWCPGFPKYNYAGLGGPYATGQRRGPGC